LPSRISLAVFPVVGTFGLAMTEEFVSVSAEVGMNQGVSRR
jgi:hypothetical protein